MISIGKNIQESIKEALITNLLSAHKKTAETCSVNEIILLTKFILKLSKDFNNDVMYFGIKESEQNANEPIKETKNTI